MSEQLIIRNTIAGQVFSELRRRIAVGQLRPGEKLRPDEIATDLDVSPTPVKEALLRLDAEGLVETIPRRGTVVRRISRNHTAELFKVREMIETWSLRAGFAADRITPQFLEQARKTVEDLSATVVDGKFTDIEQAIEADRALHDLIVSLSGNSIMIDWHRRVISQTEFVRLYATPPERATETEVEHNAIYEALQAGDLQAAECAVREHFESACRSLLPAIADDEASTRPVWEI